jgi:hypothetical protein
MGFQWLGMRITEEKDRREREARVLEHLPRAFDELCTNLSACLEVYKTAFGVPSADAQFQSELAAITVRESHGGHWAPRATVEIAPMTELPGFRIERGGEPLLIEIGLLPDDKLYYKDGEEFVTMEDLTRRILDRALFPDLGE